MTMAEPTPETLSTDAEKTHTATTFRKRFLRHPVAVAAAAFIMLLIVVAIGANVLMPQDPNATNLRGTSQGFSWDHPFGTDHLGRDVFSRVISGTRISLVAASLAVVVALVAGLPLGLVSGYFRGWVDTALMRTNDALMTFPALMLAVTIVGILGPSLRNAMAAVGIVYTPRIMRVARASTLSIREENYVLAAQAGGARHSWIIVRHVLPNLLSPLLVQVTVMMGFAILMEASLSFLGLGVQPPQASWGSILGTAFPYMSRSPIIVVSVGTLITVAVLCFNLLGDGLRDSLGVDRKGRA